MAHEVEMVSVWAEATQADGLLRCMTIKTTASDYAQVPELRAHYAKTAREAVLREIGRWPSDEAVTTGVVRWTATVPDDDECMDSDGGIYPEHDFGEIECTRCGAEADGLDE